MVVVNRIDSICGKHKMMQIKFIQNIFKKNERKKCIRNSFNEISIFLGFNGSFSKNGY